MQPIIISSDFNRNLSDSSVSLEAAASSTKKKRKVKSMFPLSAIADSKSKTVTREECIELARMIYGRLVNLNPTLSPLLQRIWSRCLSLSKSQKGLVNTYLGQNPVSANCPSLSFLRERLRRLLPESL